MKAPPKRKRIAILVAGWNQYGRGITEGAWHYAQNNHWNLDMQPSGPDGSMEMPAGWQGDGIIATVHSTALGRELEKYNVPVVNVSGARLPRVDFPRVTSDAEGVVQMAVQHLLGKGIRNIAFCRDPEKEFLEFWSRVYLRTSRQLGLVPLVYSYGSKMAADAGVAAQRKDYSRWLKSLPLPAGVIGWDTITCRDLANACELAGLLVPDQVAIISLSSEDLLGKTIHPPISGVDIPVNRIGYEAASLLDRLIQGQEVRETELIFRPVGITVRQSTDIFECEDPLIRQAMKFIKDNAALGVNVGDLLRAVPMARRTLEKRFVMAVGHSPAEEIRRIKIERVRQLLTTTDMTIADIAEASGFAYVEHMIPLFKRSHGLTPAAFRRNINGTART